MKASTTKTVACAGALLASASVTAVCAQPAASRPNGATPIPPGITTPDAVQTSLGTLHYKDGAPSPDTVAKVYDNLDLMHGVEAFVNAFQGASTYAIRQGLLDMGVEDNTLVVFSDLMDAKSIFLTANTDTPYLFGIIDLSNGPMIFEVPPKLLGTLDDMWFRWVTDVGAPGPDRGEGGKYLILPPGYDGPVPEGGYFVARSRTTRVLIIARAYLENNDPKPAAALIRGGARLYPYTQGGYGTSIAEILTGKVRPGRPTPPPAQKFVEGTGKPFMTAPANDFHYFEQIDALVQQEPAGAQDPEIMGSLAAVGIVKGQKFSPDARMRKILTDAAAIGTATGRTLLWNARASEGFAYYPGSAWINSLFVGGYNFETPPPLVTKDGIKPFPDTGYRTLNARTAMFFYATGITPAMIMRLPETGSQYLAAFVDSKGEYLDGARTYKVMLPPNIPARAFWSIIVYDNQTRSMLQTPQRYPRAGSQSYPGTAATANPDGSTTIYFGPNKPAGVSDGNWIQTDPGKGWNTLLRLYSPLEPFFTKQWRPSEIELVQ
jgi:hypothetical protein